MGCLSNANPDVSLQSSLNDRILNAYACFDFIKTQLNLCGLQFIYDFKALNLRLSHHFEACFVDACHSTSTVLTELIILLLDQSDP